MSVLRFRLRLQLHKAISLSETHIPIVNHGFYLCQAKPISYTTIKYHMQTIKNTEFNKQRETKDLIFLDDPDSFGLMSKSNEAYDAKYEGEDDKKEEEKLKFFPTEYSKLSIKEYSNLIKEHLDNKRVKEAIDVLEVRMLKDDKKIPDEYIYNLLISGCAQVGYTKKAFMLFNDMKKRGLKVTGGTYTSLFNACSNSPWPEDGAQRALKLKCLMEEKLHEPNLTNYNSMIKAFGRCGDLKKAFGIVDEMVSKKIRIRVHTFNFLLQSCITDKTSGFKHALLVWRKMLSYRENPNIYSFNLLLRCIKECSLGDDVALNQIGNLIPELKINMNEVKQITESERSIGNSDESALHSTASSDSTVYDYKTVDEMPNLIANIPHMGSVVSFNAIKSPQDRFMLIGGLDGFINEIKKWDKIPDIKTATLLLDVMPNTTEAEEKLLNMIKLYKIKTDIDFYNFLIRRRCFRHDYDGAKGVLKIIETENSVKLKKFFKRKTILKPNIMTYGILALTCTTIEDASKFLLNMKEKRLRVNTEIMGTLLKNATYRYDFEYVIYVINCVKEDSVVSNKIFTDRLQQFKNKCKYRVDIIKANQDSTTEDEEFAKGYTNFLVEFKKFVRNVETNEDIENEHPWKQYRENQPVTFQRTNPIKSKGIRYYKRPSRKHIKYIVKM